MNTSEIKENKSSHNIITTNSATLKHPPNKKTAFPNFVFFIRGEGGGVY